MWLRFRLCSWLTQGLFLRLYRCHHFLLLNQIVAMLDRCISWVRNSERAAHSLDLPEHALLSLFGIVRAEWVKDLLTSVWARSHRARRNLLTGFAVFGPLRWWTHYIDKPLWRWLIWYQRLSWGTSWAWAAAEYAWSLSWDSISIFIFILVMNWPSVSQKRAGTIIFKFISYIIRASWILHGRLYSHVR